MIPASGHALALRLAMRHVNMAAERPLFSVGQLARDFTGCVAPHNFASSTQWVSNATTMPCLHNWASTCFSLIRRALRGM